MGLLWLALGIALSACRPVMQPVVAPKPGNPSAAWERVLGEVVTPDGQVDYAALRSRRAALDDFVAWLAEPTRAGDPVRLRHADLINAYNALVLFQVLELDVPASVRDVRGWIPIPGARFFYEQAFVLEGRSTSLWEIEHELLRFKQLDFRDHAALSCAARSCPPLSHSLYRQGGLGRQLDVQMRRWLADPRRGLRLEGDVLVLSRLFDVFDHDFLDQNVGQDLCSIVRPYAPSELQWEIEQLSDRGCPVRFMDYDWAINDAPGTAREPSAHTATRVLESVHEDDTGHP